MNGVQTSAPATESDLFGDAALAVDLDAFHLEVKGVLLDAGISGSDIEFADQGRLDHFPGEGMLAATGTDEEDVHGSSPWLAFRIKNADPA